MKSINHLLHQALPPYLLVDEYMKIVDYPNHCRALEDCRFVYLCRNELSGLCKIGITNNPKVRLSQLANQSGMPIQSLMILECQVDYDEHPSVIEKFLHKYFHNKRKYGEWFDLSIKDIIAVKNLFYRIEGEYIDDNIRLYLSKSN